MANYERPPSPSSGNSFDPIHSGDASASLIQLETAERNDELEAGEEDDLLSDESADEGSPFMRNGRIDVGGPAWDESEDEDEAVLSDDDDPGAPLALSSSQRKRKRRAQRPDSYFATLRPSAAHRRICWRFLTSKGTPASLSAPHVCANLFAASLHPAVLLSMPHFFQRTGISLGVVGLIVVGILGGVGGGVWVVLGRYVGRSTVEAITGASFGKTTKWKGNIGKAVSGIMLAVYATGAAVIAYFGEFSWPSRLGAMGPYIPTSEPLADAQPNFLQLWPIFSSRSFSTIPLVVFLCTVVAL